MRKNYFGVLLFLFTINICFGQTLDFADSIRKEYHIPELAYAVISPDKIIELNVIGVKKINTTLQAEYDDRFRIGSNTKAITGFIAAQLVKSNKINWETKFFDLFPELKSKSKRAYHQLTLLDLLTFRTKLYPYTYTYDKPTKDQFSGNEEQQRYQFTTWFFQQTPIKSNDSINFSNLGYIAAGLMLEKASGKPYKELVEELGKQLEIEIGFGNPNENDSLQPSGHNADLIPESPGDNYKLNWLLPAGNLNMSLPDYAKFIQLQLQGLAGKSNLLTGEEFQFLLFGLTKFSVGWFSAIDESNRTYAWNIGNPGTFLTSVVVYKDIDLAIVLFSNAQTPETELGFDVLYAELKKRYVDR